MSPDSRRRRITVPGKSLEAESLPSSGSNWGPALLPFDIAKEIGYSFGVAKEAGARKTDVLQGTLDLMVLQTLHSMGPQHGYGLARRIEQISESTLKLNEGTVYASLMRLQHGGLISSSWGTSEHNRKAKFYAITKRGKGQLSAETENWHRIAWVIGRLLGAPSRV